MLSSEFKIIMTSGVVVIKIINFSWKLGVVSNSSSNSLFFYSCSKIIVSFVIGACKASGFT
jgi:hypothetical protein